MKRPLGFYSELGSSDVYKRPQVHRIWKNKGGNIQQPGTSVAHHGSLVSDPADGVDDISRSQH